MSKFLNAHGVETLWTKIKNLFSRHTGIYKVYGTQTATTATWTGEINAPELYDGMTIAYYLPRTSASNVTLELTLSDGTKTGNIPVYFTGSTRMGTHYGAGSTVILTYWSAPYLNGTKGSARWTHADYSTTNASKLSTARYINGVSFNATANITNFAVCNTNLDVSEKIVECDGFSLITGAIVVIYFANSVSMCSTYADIDDMTYDDLKFLTYREVYTRSEIRLNVNNTGPKAVLFHNATIWQHLPPSDYTLAFVYDGEYFRLIGI